MLNYTNKLLKKLLVILKGWFNANKTKCENENAAY